MKNRFHWAVAALVTIALLGGMAVSCKNNPKKKAQQPVETEVVDAGAQVPPEEVKEIETACYDGATDITKKWFQDTWEYMEYYEDEGEKALEERGFNAGLLNEYTLMTLEDDTPFYFLKEGKDLFAELTDDDIESILVIRKGGKYIDGGYEFDCFIPDPRKENGMLRFGISTLNGEEVFTVADNLWRKAKN